jgi:hypothetical protein
VLVESRGSRQNRKQQMEAPINKISRSLPGGGEAKNLTEYFAAWDALRGPLETELGLETVGYDPGLLMRDPTTGDRLELSVGMAMKLSAKLAQTGRNSQC